MLDISGVDQPRVEPGRFEQIERGLPVVQVASITTRVIPSARSRSAIVSSDRVIVE
jgi:hypothetical protein